MIDEGEFSRLARNFATPSRSMPGWKSKCVNPYLVAMEHARAVSSTVRPTVLSARVGIWTLLSSVQVGNLVGVAVAVAVAAAWAAWGTKFQPYGRRNDDAPPIRALRRSTAVLLKLIWLSLSLSLLLPWIAVGTVAFLSSSDGSDDDGDDDGDGDEKASHVVAITKMRPTTAPAKEE